MQRIKTNILSKIVVVILTTSLLFPLLVKFEHLLENHEHTFCDTPYKTHFHNYDVDCEFYNFTLNTIYFNVLPTYSFLETSEIHEEIVSQYQFISEYQRLHFSLRGPPLSV